jgi:hypothetical protein
VCALACSYSVSAGAEGRPRRNFGSNSLDGTIPAALSALKLLTALCVRPARNAAPLLRSVNRAPLLRRTVRVSNHPCELPRTYPCTAVRVSSQPVAVGTPPVPVGMCPVPGGTGQYPRQYPRLQVLREYPWRTGGRAGISARTRSTARSPPRCRCSTCCVFCASAPCAMPRRVPHCERRPVRVSRYPGSGPVPWVRGCTPGQYPRLRVQFEFPCGRAGILNGTRSTARSPPRCPR